MTFKWFTSIPNFVAEQIEYVLDANDLTRLKMFKTRIHDKIVEAECASLEKYADTSPKDHESYCRISKQVSFISEAVKSIKKVMSPDKRIQKVNRSTGQNDDNLCKSLFSSDSDDDTNASKKFKKPSKSSRKLVRGAEKVSLSSGSSHISVNQNTFNSDFEQLPSTQDIEKVFDSWKESKDQKLQNKRVEKRKRSSMGKNNNLVPTKNVPNVQEISATLFDNFDDDSDFANISESQLLAPITEKRRPVDAKTNDSYSIVEQTRYVEPNKCDRQIDKLPSTDLSTESEKNTCKSFEPKLSSRFLDAITAPKKTFDLKLPGQVLNSLVKNPNSSLDDVSRVPDTFANWSGKSLEVESAASNCSRDMSKKSIEFSDTVANAFDKTFEPASVSHISDTFSKGFTPKCVSTFSSTAAKGNEKFTISANSSLDLPSDLLSSANRIADTLCSMNFVPATDPINSRFKLKAPSFGNTNFPATPCSIQPYSNDCRDRFDDVNTIDRISSPASSSDKAKLSNGIVTSLMMSDDDDLFDEIFESQFPPDQDHGPGVELSGNGVANKENVQKNVRNRFENQGKLSAS